MDGTQKQRRTTPSAPPPSKSAIKEPEPPGESLLSLLQRGTSSKDLLSFSSSANQNDNSRNIYLVSPDKSRESNEVLHFVDPAVAALGPSHPITYPLQNPNNIEDAENPLLQYAIGTPHPHNFHNNLDSIPNTPLNYLPPSPSWIPQTFNSDVSGGFLGFPPPPLYAFSNVQSQERFASPHHSQFTHVHQNASGNDAMLGPQTMPHVHSQDVRNYPLQTEPKTFSTPNSEKNAFSTHDSDTAQGKKLSAPKLEGKMVLDSKREGKMLAASFSVPSTGKSEIKKFSAPVTGKAEMKVVVRPQGEGSEEGSVNLMFGSLDWNSEKLHAEEKGKVKGGVRLLQRSGTSQAQGSDCIAESSKANQRNEQYQAPRDGKYQAPRNGQYQAPRNRQYQSPWNEQYQMPRNEQHQTPRNGQYSTPHNERYQMPRNGQYQMPRNGYIVKQKSNVIMNKVNGADVDGVAGELRSLRLDEEYKESELSPSSGGKQKVSGFSQRRRRLKQHFPEGAGEEAKDGPGGTLNFQDSPRYKQRTTQGSLVAFEEEHKLDKNQGMSRNQQLEIENRRVRVKQTQVDINQKRRLQFWRLKEIDFRHCEDLEILTKRFLSIYQSLIPKKEEEAKRGQLLFCLQNVVQRKWPESKLHLFGSCANAFGVSNSDIDVCLSIDKEEVTKSELVLELAEILKDEDMQNVQALAHARVPIVKFTDPITKISCDICINNILAVENTKLLYDYAQIDVRLKQLAFMVKHWAKSRNINETYRGTLSSYAYVLMCIHFLQQRRPAILPCLQAMQATYHVKIGNIDCAYYDKVENLREFGYQNKETLGHLLSAFFDYWAFDHDYANSVVSIRTGGLISKRNKDWTRRIGNERHLICIEDPFETSHDLGRVVDKYSIRVIKEEFLRAAEIMHYDSDPSITLFQPCTPRQ